MNKKEAAIISAYTGKLIGDFSEMHKYIDEFMWKRIKKASEEDFRKLIRDNKITERESAIISAYTGYIIGTWENMAKYIEEKLGRKISDDNLHLSADEIKAESHDDFMELMESIK